MSDTNPTPDAKSGQKTKKPIRRTYVLMVDDEIETKAIQEAVAERFGKLGAERVRAVSELRMARLMDDDEVIVGLMRNVRGQVAVAGTRAKREVVFTEPLPVRDHWDEDPDDGIVRRSSFMGALASRAIAAAEGVVKEKDGLLRVCYA